MANVSIWDVERKHVECRFLNKICFGIPILLNSWSGQTDTGSSVIAFGNMELNFHTKIIPPKTTKYCQPLDDYFFRQYKQFSRRIEENTRHDEGNTVKLNDRIFIFKLHSLMYTISWVHHSTSLCFTMRGRLLDMCHRTCHFRYVMCWTYILLVFTYSVFLTVI